MPVIRLVCSNAALALERAAQLEAAGFSVDASPFETSRVIGHFRETSPAAALNTHGSSSSYVTTGT